MSVLIHVGVRARPLQVDPLLARRFGAARRRQEGDPLRPDRRLPQFCRSTRATTVPNTCPAWSTPAYRRRRPRPCRRRPPPARHGLHDLFRRIGRQDASGSRQTGAAGLQSRRPRRHHSTSAKSLPCGRAQRFIRTRLLSRRRRSRAFCVVRGRITVFALRGNSAAKVHD